jgi:hypothetical protein
MCKTEHVRWRLDCQTAVHLQHIVLYKVLTTVIQCGVHSGAAKLRILVPFATLANQQTPEVTFHPCFGCWQRSFYCFGAIWFWDK